MCDPEAVGLIVAFLASMGITVRLIVDVLKGLIKKYIADGEFRTALIRVIALAVCIGISAIFIAIKHGDWGCLFTYGSELFAVTQFTALVKKK